MSRLKNRGEQSQTEKEFCEILQLADPIVSRFVSEHEAFRARNEALVERVAVLERALEEIAANRHSFHRPAGRIAREALDG